MTKLRILKNSKNLVGWSASYGKTKTNSLDSPVHSLLSSQELACGRSSMSGSGQCCRILRFVPRGPSFFCTCSLTQETDCQESLTCFDFLSSVKPKECPGKGREERGKGMITSPATSGRVTPPLRVTFQVEPTPSSTALSLTKCPLLAWSLVPIISYSVNSSFIKLCLDYTSFFFPLLQPIKSPVIITMDHWGCFSSWTLS